MKLIRSWHGTWFSQDGRFSFWRDARGKWCTGSVSPHDQPWLRSVGADRYGILQADTRTELLGILHALLATASPPDFSLPSVHLCRQANDYRVVGAANVFLHKSLQGWELYSTSAQCLPDRMLEVFATRGSALQAVRLALANEEWPVEPLKHD